MTASTGFADFLRDTLAPLGRVTARRMFGKTGLFCDGAMFALVGDDVLYLRVDDSNRDTFRAAGVVTPLTYVKQGVRMELPYWAIPEPLLDEPEALLSWARAALLAAQRVAARRGAADAARIAAQIIADTA